MHRKLYNSSLVYKLIMPLFVELKGAKWIRNDRPILDWSDQVMANSEMIKYRVSVCPLLEDAIRKIK